MAIGRRRVLFASALDFRPFLRLSPPLLVCLTFSGPGRCFSAVYLGLFRFLMLLRSNLTLCDMMSTIMHSLTPQSVEFSFPGDPTPVARWYRAFLQSQTNALRGPRQSLKAAFGWGTAATPLGMPEATPRPSTPQALPLTWTNSTLLTFFLFVPQCCRRQGPCRWTTHTTPQSVPL